MKRILGERNQNAAAPSKPSPVFEEWKAVHEVNRAEIGNNGSFLEFGEEAVDCMEAEEELDENAPPLTKPMQAVLSKIVTPDEQLARSVPPRTTVTAAVTAAGPKATAVKTSGWLSQEEDGDEEKKKGVNGDKEDQEDGRSSIFSSDASSDSFENDESEVESGSIGIEFSAASCSTPLPSSEVIIPSVPLISVEFSGEKFSLSIGTRALWRVVKWSILPAFAVASYFYCPYLQYRVDKFIMEF